MPAKNARSRVVTGCLLTSLLLSAGAALAQSRTEPEFGLCWVEDDPAIGLRPAAAKDPRFPTVAGVPLQTGGLGGATGPWFLKSLDLLRTDALCSQKPADAAPSTTEPPAQAQLDLPEVQLPATVGNLRRTDQK